MFDYIFIMISCLDMLVQSLNRTDESLLSNYRKKIELSTRSATTSHKHKGFSQSQSHSQQPSSQPFFQSGSQESSSQSQSQSLNISQPLSTSQPLSLQNPKRKL